MNDDSGQVRPDMVVSDLDGVSSSQRLTQTIANLLRDQGYSVNINHPYKGAELIKRYSHPDRKRHSVQIEISRALYMDEKKFEKSVNFNLLSRNLRNFIIDLTSVIKSSEF